MSKIKFKIIFSFILLGYIFFSCGTLLTDTNNPENIRATIELSRKVNNETRSVKSLIQVTLKDELGFNIELDGGKIYVNDSIMSPPNWAVFGSKRSYYKSTIPVLKDSEYAFKIVFPDSSFYEAWIETPEKYLTQMDIPLSHLAKQPLTFSWQQVDFRYPQYCHVQWWNVEEEKFETQKLYEIKYPYLGQFTIEGKYLKYHNDDAVRDDELRIGITSQTTGVISYGFAEDSSIKCEFILYQNIEIYK